ncbi:MAG: CopG family transcriptional regulator [Candidatus Margulisbacteria bacterium]|nr:CopG family transcriptional regulator [Candidatus Margulisiibacteriota bacterium]
MMKTKKQTKIIAADLDKKFDEGKESVLRHFDTESIKVNKPLKRINIDIPMNMIKEIDVQARKIGVARTALIKMWLSQHIRT